jgi:hypothetical protein
MHVLMVYSRSDPPRKTRHQEPPPVTRAPYVVASLLLCTWAADAAANAPDLARLAWLSGCWASDTAEPGSGEFWLPPAGDVMLGIGRTIRQGRTTEHEFMQIRALEDGRIAFVANPSGQARATFPLASVTATEIVFENPQHDFPQRIVYRLVDQAHLDARIEGMQDGELRVVGFPMHRVTCDAQQPAP